MNINYCIFTLLIPLIIQISPCSGTAKLMLRFDSFENTRNLKENGECCDGERRNGNCTGRCDYSMRVCLSRNATGDPCEIQTFEVGTVDVAASSFNFPNTFVSGFANPVPISLDRWQGDIIVSVYINDEDTLREERVDSYNLTYTRFAPVSNRPIVNDDFLPYTLIGKRVISPTSLDIAVTVQCDRFFHGEECLVNCVENDDCNGHYTCNGETGAKICNEGWGGDNCSISLSADHGCFASQTCANRAECIRYGNNPSEYYCCCAPGYTGTNCEIDVDECASGPCENGGSCTQDEPNSFTCFCPIRFKGIQCQTQRDCSDDPCLNGGQCRSVVGSFFCICNENYTGDICETSLLTTPAPTPACPSNYFGPSCSVFCVPRNDCSGHYGCDSENGNRICNPTWGGVNCTIRNFVDATCPCLNRGQCFDNQCCCPEGFSGSLCGRQLFCSDGLCLNGGQCYEENNGFRCECRQGFTGENCETVVPICPADFYGPACSVFCRPQEDCFGGQWSCNPVSGARQCRFGWIGSLCNERDPTARHRVACPDSDCRNGGICANSTCCCPVGYTGSLCHIEILECASNPCQNNGRCEDLIGDYLCLCRPGFTGKNCENFMGGSTSTEEPDPCLNVNCLNGGTCASNSSTAAICLCQEGFMGELCEITARTTTPGQPICPENFYGPSCLIFCREENSCERGHFYCDTATGQRICRNGWIGSICQTRVLLQEYDPECPAVGCRNRGQCFNGSCCCPDSSQGEFCQVEILACDTQPCRNGGTCQDLANGYTCTCPAGFAGVDCATIVETTTPSSTNNNTLEACDQARCQNGGVCIPTLLPFSCLCPNPFSGRYCEINMFGTSTTTYLQTIYLRGNVSDNNQAAIQDILQRAVSASATSSSCCVVLYIVEKTSYVDQAGDVVVGYVYNVTHSSGGTITPGQTDSLNNEVNTELRRTEPFRRNGVVVYTGPVQVLTNIDLAYSVDFIGEIPASRRQSVIADIEAAWRNAYPDCRCQFRVNIATTEQFAGEYGITVSRVYYTITRDGQAQDPATTQQPSRNIYINTVRGRNSLNTVYSGSFLLPYNQRHSILLSGVMDLSGDQGRVVRDTIRSAWIQWKDNNPAVPENLRNTQVDIIMLRPKVYYTQDGSRLSNVEYFVLLNNTIIIGPQGDSPTINSPLFCTGCTAIPVPFVDIRGSLSSDQIRILGANLNPSDPGGFTINSEQFINSNGDPVTRVYYQPPISGPGVQSTAVSQQRLTTILTNLNLQQPSQPIDRTFAVTFAGTVTANDQEGIRQILTNAWADTFGIPRELISVNINSMDDTFTSSSGNGQLTQVSYTVSVQGADSHWTRFEGLDLAILRRYFTSPNLVVVGGEGTLATLETTLSVTGLTTSAPTTTTISLVDVIYLSGNISDNNQGAVEEVLRNALNRSRTGSPCCVTLYIIERTTYTDPSGQTVTGYRYNISSSNGTPPSLTPEQRRNFTTEISTELQNVDFFRQIGVVIYTGPIQDLRTVGFTYSADFVGDVPESRRQAVITAIERAWYAANPGCGCQFEANFERTDEFTGDYGIRISRVFYTMTRDGQLQDPDTVAPPPRNILYTTSLRDTTINPVYSGSSLLKYDQHHSVLLNGAVDLSGDQGRTVRDAIQTAWTQFRDSFAAFPPALRNAPLDIVLLRPQTYYTPDGRQLTKVEYFVVLNGTIIIGPQAANVSLSNNPMFCDGCRAVPVPSVDVNGRLTPDQLLALGLNLDPTGKSLEFTVPVSITYVNGVMRNGTRKTPKILCLANIDTNGDNINSEIFLTSNGQPVTRVYYRPPISGPGVQSTAVSQQRLTTILTSLNLQQPSQPIDRTFDITFAGIVTANNQDVIRQILTNAWVDTFGIPRELISVNINSMDTNSSGNGPLTQVSYTVTVQGADSHWTRFEGLNLGILRRYFTSPNLVVVGGEGTLPTLDTTSSVTGQTTRPPTTTTISLVETIYLSGNISDNNQGAVEEVLRNALNRSRTGSPCCVTLHIIERTTYTNPSGETVTGYRYNISSSNGTPPSLTPEQRRNFTTEISTGLQNVDFFRQFGVVIYTGSIQDLRTVGFTYSVDFVGDVPESQRQAVISAIERAWYAANPGCGCQFQANIERTDDFTGDYGIRISRVFYTMTRDGQLQDPITVAPPSRNILYATALRDTNTNSVYSGSSLLKYDQHHSVLLNGAVDLGSDQGRIVRDTIQTAWVQFRDTSPALPPALRNVPLDIVLLRPQTYYTPDGRELTNVEYFVVLNGTIIIGPQAANVSFSSNPMFCDGCRAVSVPSVDVNGRLTPDQLLEFGLNLDPTDTNGDNINSEIFLTSNGQPVTRVYYRPPISGPGVQSTAVSQQRLTTILTSLNLQQPSQPIDRTFDITFAGIVTANNQDAIRQILTNAWADTFGISRELISVNINSMDTSSSGNGPLTQVSYTVTVQGADSHWTRFEGLNLGILRRYFTSPNLVVVGGEGTLPTLDTTPSVTGQTTRPPTTTTISLVETIYLSGNISDNNQGAVEEVLRNALNRSRTGSPCCVTLHIIERTTYTNPSGETVTGYRYNISSSNGTPPSLTPEQRRNFTTEISTGLQNVDFFRQFGVVIYTGSIQDLRTVGFTYSVDFVGDVPESQRQAVISAIERAWYAANPGCGCQFQANIERTDEFTGDYGIRISRVFYTMTRDGQLQDPITVVPPSRNILYATALRDTNTNSVYSGSSLLKYDQHHSVLLNGAVDLGSDQGRIVRDAIQTAWVQFRDTSPALPPALRNVPLDIVLLRPQAYYTPDGQELTNVEYFVVLNGTIIIGPQAANVSFSNNPMFCDGCRAVSIPSVDVNGRLTPDQLLEFGLNLDPTGKSLELTVVASITYVNGVMRNGTRKTPKILCLANIDTNGDNINSEIFLTSNGQPVTRVYYRPPISGPGVQSTAVSQQRLTTILTSLNLQQPSQPIDRTFDITFAGIVTANNQDAIRQILTNAWADTFGISRELISVNINSMDTSSSGNGPLTQVSYTVTVQGADSHWTRFEGPNLGILRRYFTSPNLVVVGGEGTLPTLDTTPSVTGQTTRPPTTTTISLVETIYLSGNITDNNQGAVEEVLRNALNKSRTGSPCCVTLHIIERTTYTNPSGEIVTGYRYNISSSNGTPPSLTPEQRRNFTTEISTGLQNVDFFRQFGVVIYTGSIQDLRTVGFTYSVDFVGDVPESQRQAVISAIERAWYAANPGCGCQFQANIERTDEFTGDYGIRISRVFYTMTRDGQLQDPITVAPPSRNILYATALRDTNTNSVYSGSSLLKYDQHHSVLLNGAVDMGSDQGRIVRDTIQTAWVQFRDTSTALPPALRNVPLDIVLLRPQAYYTPDGRELTNVEYFVVLNGTIIIGPQAANVSFSNNPMFCDGCRAVPVPSVDVNGRLTPDQLLEFGLNLDPTDTNRNNIDSETFLTTNGGTVTRVYYRPPISGPDVQSTAVSQQRLNEILTDVNLQQPSQPTERTFVVNFAGSVGNNNTDTIGQTIINAWANTHGIPRDAISVKISNMDDNFRSTSNGQVTQVTYTVSVQGADSQWTRFNGVDQGNLGGYFRPTGLVVVTGQVINRQTTGRTTVSPGGTTVSPPSSNATFLIQTIFLRGNISDNNQAAIEELLQTALNTSVNGTCCRTLQILDKVTFLDPLGDVVVGYRFNVSNSTGDIVTPLTQRETLLFQTQVLDLLQRTRPFRQLGTVTYIGSVDELTSVQFTYTVDFIGDIPYFWRAAIVENIEAAWRAAYPGCQCVFRGNFVYTDKFSGDYGITVSRVYYTMTRDGRTQDPTSVQPPAWTVLANLVRGDNRVNSLYSGSVLLPYRLHHTVLLSGVVDIGSGEGRNVRSLIETAWLNWRDTNPAVPPNLRTATLEIVLRRPQMYYTQDGKELTYLEYFVVLNGTFIIGSQSATVPLTDPIFCDGCPAIPVPFVEVRGRLNTDQLRILGNRLNPSDTSGTSVRSESYVNTNGQAVTRVYYQPPISGPGVQSTALSPQRVAVILSSLNLQQPSLPEQRTFTINFAGSINNNNRNVILQTIRNAWAGSFNIPESDLTVEIISMDDNFITTANNGQVTQVTYRVTIQGADSLWTRFEGLPQNTLDNYFRPTSLVIIRGAIQSTRPSTVTPTPTSPTTNTPVTTQIIYIRGNITSQNQTVVEEILQNALNRSRNGSSCCLRVHIIEWTSYVDSTGDSVIGYTYNVTNGSEPVTLTPEEVTNFTKEINNEIVTISFIDYGYVLYTGTATELKNVNLTYTVDFVGDIPDSQRQAVIADIERAWQNANPGCGCIYTASVMHIEEYNGDYGTTVNRVYYTISRDGQVQDPSIVQPPTQNVFQTTVQATDSVSSVYTGSSPLPYNQRHTILLNSVIDIDSPVGTQVQNAIRTAWITWRNTDPSVPGDLRNAPVDIRYLRPQTYYTQDGRNVTNVEYFVLLNNSMVIGPQRANISLTGSIFCGTSINCVALPVPFVDVNGDLTTDQILSLGSRLNPSDPSGSTLNSQVFVNYNNEPVTRVYYRPPISGRDVQSTAVSQQRLNEILTNENMEQPSLPIERTYIVNFAGSLGENDKARIEETIRNVWRDRYGVPADVLSVNVNNMDDSFYTTASNGQVTQVDYTVSIQGVDSHWTRYEGVDDATIGLYFTNPDLTVVLGEVTNIQTGGTTPSPGSSFLVQTIYLMGNISENNQPALEEILQNVLNRSINGSSCCLTLHIIGQTTYMDPSENVVVGYQYNVSNSTGGAVTPMTPGERTDFRNEVNNELQRTEPFRQFGTVLYTGRVEELIYIEFAYTVDIIGDIPDSQRRAVISDIERAWQNANPDCRCLYKVSLVNTREFTGEYGIKVSRVVYTITRDGQIQDPATTQPPSRNVFITTLQEDTSVSSAYSGTLLMPYDQRHSVLLNGVMDMASAEGAQVIDAILRVWTNWRNVHPAVPESLRNTPVEIRLLRTQPYYTQDGNVLTRLEYFVILNGTVVIGPQAVTPQLTGPYFCEGCNAISVPFVDIKGQLSPTQLQQLTSALNPAVSSGSTVTIRSFLDVNNEPVTRVYYRPPISGPQVQSTAVSQQRLTEILNNLSLGQPSPPLDRTYAVNFAGSIGFNNRDSIEQTIKNVWVGTFGIPNDALTVNIVDMDDNYVSATSNNQVTRVTYTVTIQGADSYWTRFEGVDPGTLGRYFTSSDLVVVGGEVIYTQYPSSTPESSSTASSSSSSPTQPPATGSPFVVQTVYFKGNVSDENAGAVQTILQTALNRSMNGMSCCVMVQLLEKTTYADPSTGDIYVGYRYNMTNSTGGTVQNLAPEQTNNFIADVNNQLQRIDPFRQDGVVVYTGLVQSLRNIGVAYYVDFIGSIPDSRRTTIVNTINGAWRTAFPGCGCQFSSEILLTVPLSGDYGIALTRVYYTMTRDEQIQSPVNVAAPASDVFFTTAQGDISVNSVYSGSSILPYNQRHSVLLNRVVDVTGSQGSQVQAALRTVWNTWRNNNQNFPQSLRSASLEILLLRPQTYYTQAGTLISNVEYFVIIDGTIIIGPNTASPPLTGPLFCGCEALPVPFVDVKGHLDWSKSLQLGTSLNPDETAGTSLIREMYYDANGMAVTRLFYRPSITNSSVQSTAVQPTRLTEILTSQELEQPSTPIRKSFTFYFDGSLGEDHENAIKDGIMNAWSGSFAVPTEDISVNILNMNDNFYNTNGNGQVTRVIYTLSIQGADSRWTKYEGLNNEDLSQFFTTSSPDVTPCGCIASEGREIMLTGTVGNDTSSLETALINAWMAANPDYAGTLSIGITQVEGATPTKLKYTVTPSGGTSAITDSDLTPPSVDVLNNQLHPNNAVHIDDKGDDSGSVLAWAIPVGIILGLLLLLIIILIIFCVIRNRRNRMSHTLKQRPEDMNGYDKQHFSDEPHFENPAFDMEDPDVGDAKQRTYVVNEEPNMEEIKLR